MGCGVRQPFELPAVFITKYFNIFRKCFEPTFVSRSKYHLSSSGNNNNNKNQKKFIRFIFRPKGVPHLQVVDCEGRGQALKWAVSSFVVLLNGI